MRLYWQDRYPHLGFCLVASVITFTGVRRRGQISEPAHLSFVLCKKVSRNDEIEDTVNCSPAYELDEEFERRLGDHTSDPRRGQCQTSKI